MGLNPKSCPFATLISSVHFLWVSLSLFSGCGSTGLAHALAFPVEPPAAPGLEMPPWVHSASPLQPVACGRPLCLLLV